MGSRCAVQCPLDPTRPVWHTQGLRFPLYLCVLTLGLGACSETDSTPTPQRFDPTAVFEVFDRDVQVGDLSYPADVVQLFRTSDTLPSLEVGSLAVIGDEVYAGGPGGLMRLAEGRQAFVEVAGWAEPVTDLSTVQDSLLVALSHRAVRLDPQGVLAASYSVGSATVSAVAADEAGRVLVGTTDGLRIFDAAGTLTGTAAQGLGVRDLLVTQQVVFMATSEGVQRFDLSSDTLLPAWRAPLHLADNDVRAVALATGRTGLWAATGQALSLITIADASAQLRRPGLESGLVTDDLRALVERAGVLLVGHQIGATAFISDRVEHYHSLRWLPDEQVNAVAIDNRGDKWVGTPGGIARLSTEMQTLSQRAEINEGYLQDRHWRMDGFVDDRISLADPWAFENIRTGDHDNDGLWTEMQIGAWCYAYAVTGEERFYDSARKAVDVMFLQIDIPGKTFEAAGKKRGFITRSLVRDDEGEVFSSKATQDNWHLEEWQGRQYYWKDDTSSDEYAGHYFGLPIFHDLCAKTDAERAEVAAYLEVATRYVMDGDYVLIDLDGQPTLHGHWEDLAIGLGGVDHCVDRYGIERAADCLSSRHGGGWLNGTEVLGMLLATWHATGDPAFYDEYERLFTDERYGELVNVSDETFTVAEPPFANHSDHELAMLAYTTLLRYEPNPERRAQYVQSLLDFYEYEREEHNPWQVAIIGAYHPAEVDTEGALRTLRDMPLDWRTWLVDNAHRKDAARWPDDRHGTPQFSRVFPYDEIRTMKWNGSPYAISGGGSGQGVLAPTPYLLAYWMLRYYKVLDP